LAQPDANPLDRTDPRNLGPDGTYNEPDPGNDANQIHGWFTSYLGRPPSNDDMVFWLNQAKVNTGGLNWVQNQLANSPEAQAYARRPGGSLNQTKPADTTVSGPASSTGPTGTASVTGPATSAFTDELRKILMDRIKESSKPVDANSPEILAALQAARDEASRSSDSERTALAERLYAQGVGTGGGALQSGALTQQIQQSSERTAGSLAKVRASLLMNAYNNKFQELRDNLQLAFASGDAESARAIQIQIANLQATIQREVIGSQMARDAADRNQSAVGG
jgi:hypothetical protein